MKQALQQYLSRSAYLLLGVFACFASTLRAQETAKQYYIHLKNERITPAANTAHWSDSVSQIQVSKEPVQVLLQFSTLPTPEQKAFLQKNGITLLDYIPDNTFTAFIQLPLQNDALKQLPVHAVINTKLEWKASDYLWQQVNKNINSSVEVLVSFYQNIPGNAVRTFIQQHGGTIQPDLMEAYGNYKVVIAASKVKDIAQWYGLKYISPVSSIVPLDLQARPAVKANTAPLATIYGGYNLKGDSVTVGIGDNTSGIFHIDNKDRVINFNPAPYMSHGVFINGILGGAAIIDPMAEGMAPHVTMIDHLYDNILFYAPSMFQSFNMTITNNSYALIEGSCSYAGTYDTYSQFIDQQLTQYPSLIDVFAAGNDGLLNCSPYAQGYASVVGGYQPAKNSIVVTSITDYLGHADDGSRGPVKDGRLKPDLSAVGLGQYSTLGNNQYEWSAGTSIASPQVAGGLVLLTQRYKQKYGAANPRSDVLKAILLNDAMDLGNPGPDYNFGFGVMDVYRSLKTIDSTHFAVNNITNGSSQPFSISVPTNTAQLKVMIYWNDTPANPASAIALVNDLDLTVTDPSSNIHLPLVLDTTTANITNNATEGTDHLNNVEQVTINNPQAGNYTATIKGYNVPSASQPYAIAYDIIPVGVQLTYPTTGEKWNNVDSLRIFWEANSDSNTFKIEFSTDNGGTWSTLNNNIAADQRYYVFIATGINSGNCLLRLTKNNTTQQYTTGKFAINNIPVVALDSIQCPGYINIHWSPVPNAMSYQVYSKQGIGMQVVDIVTDTTYTFKGLSLDSTYYVSAGPLLNGLSGYRAVAVTRQPNTGTCANNVSLGDLTTEQILAPNNGRKLTSIQLNNNETLSVKVRNLYNIPCNNYSLSYSLNGSAWQSFSSLPSIPADSFVIVNTNGLDLSVIGVYQLRVAAHNLALTDPVPQNDTAAKTILNLDNDTLNITNPFVDGFETMSAFSIDNDSIGISPNGHWDYSNTSDTGRLRTYIDDSITITGNRSISLDANQYTHDNQNYFTGTFNMSNYNASNTEVRISFDYIFHGKPKLSNGNQLWIRGNDTQLWLPLYKYDTTVTPGNVNHSSSLSVTDELLHNSQNFSTSFQAQFGQYDTSLIAARDYGNGVTIDNFSIYTVQNDMQLLSIVSPQYADCGLGAATPLTIQLFNSVSNTQSNVRLYYQLDNGTIITDTLPTIGPKDTIDYTFLQLMNLSVPGEHSLNVWLSATGDTYTANDSILNYQFYNQPLIATFPYLENFEGGAGYWYTQGTNDSWQYGTPASAKIHKAASGIKAWKTNLSGYYNNNERSYLYSPCFDISNLANPMLSFSTAMDIENCGSTLCDAGYMEYSYDGVVWTKLGAAGQGTNWYDSTFDIWNEEGNTRWHVASILLPVSTQPIRLRFVLVSDPGATFEGIAVDDIHIFDRIHGIYDDNIAQVSVSQNLVGNQWTGFIQSNQLLAQINPNGQNLGNMTSTLYKHDTITNPGATQYTFPRSYTVKGLDATIDTAGVRLFITDSEVLQVINDATCPSCSKPADAYSLGITKYDNRMVDLEDGTLTDNIGGKYSYYPYNQVIWVPSDIGYYAQVNVNSFSEFWFNDGGPTRDFPAGIDYLLFNAQRITSNEAAINWTSYIDTAVSKYELQSSPNDSNFSTISIVPALHYDTAMYTYTDTPNITQTATTWYRLRYTMINGNVYYSPIRRVNWDNNTTNTLVSVYPNPTNNGTIYIQWTAPAGTQIRISMTDIEGRKMLETTTTATQWNNLTVLQTPHFADGVYFLKIEIAGNKWVKKIVYDW